MELSEISCSPALTDTDFSVGTYSFDNDEKIVCKYPDHSHISPAADGMQPVLSGGSNSDRSVTYTGLFPKDDFSSSLQYIHKTVHSAEANCALDINPDFKEPLPPKSKFTIKPVKFYNSLNEMSINNEDDYEVTKSPKDAEILSEISNLQNSLNETDLCASKSTKTKSSGFWRKSSRMVSSYVFEAALDETSSDNTIDKSNIKFTFRRKRKSEANENCFSEAFNSRNISDYDESSESMEDTNKVKRKSLNGTLTENSLINCNIKTTGFKINPQSNHTEKRFSEAFNNTESSGHSVSEDISVKAVELSIRSHPDESLHNCGNFCKDLKNNKQMVTSGVFQDVFNGTDSLNMLVPSDTAMKNNLNNKNGHYLPTVDTEQTIPSNKNLEYSDTNILHENGTEEQIISSLHKTNVQSTFDSIKENKRYEAMKEILSGGVTVTHPEESKSSGHSIIRNLSSESQRNFDSKYSNGKCDETDFDGKIVSKVEGNECSSQCKLKENDPYSKAVSKRKACSLALVESESFKRNQTNILSPSFRENIENCTTDLNYAVPQNNRSICESAAAKIHNQSLDKQNKQNEILNSMETSREADRIVENSTEVQKKEQGSHCTLGQILCKENVSVDKILHKNCPEEGLKQSKPEENDQDNLDESEYFKSADNNENCLNPDTANLESELKTSSSRDSFCLEVQEETSVLAKKICTYTNPDEGKKSATGDAHVVHDILIHNENTSVLPSTGKVSNISINSENNEGRTTLSEANVKNGVIHLSQTVGNNSSVVSFQSLVYEQSDGKTHEDVNDGTSALFEFHASKSLKCSSSVRSSVWSTDRDSSQQNTDLSKLHPNIQMTQITDESGALLNSLNNSLISTAASGSESNDEDTYEPIETSTLNDSLDSTLTENRNHVSDEANNTKNPNSFIISQSASGIKSNEKYINMNKQDGKNSITRKNFSKSVDSDINNKSRECKEKKEQSVTAVEECAAKSFLQESSSLEGQGGKYQSLVSTKTSKCISDSALTSDGSQRKRRSEYLEINNVPSKSRRLSNRSKEIQNITSSINMEHAKDGNDSFTHGSLVSHQTTNIKHSEQDVDNIMHPEVSSKSDIKIQAFSETSENKSLSDCSHNTQLHSKISNASKNSQAPRKKLKRNYQNKQKQADVMAKDNNVSTNNNRSRNHCSGIINHSNKETLKQVNKIEKTATMLANSNRNSEVTENSVVNIEINKTLQHDESNEDNGYDIGYNTFSSTNMDYTPCNEAVINKRSRRRKLNALRKCLFNSSILQNETDAREFSIPFSELHKRTEKVLNNENKFATGNSFVDNELSDDPNMAQNKKNKQFSYKGWATKATKDFIISKLKPKYGVKANWRCQKLIDFMGKKISETIRNSRNYNVPVDEIKLELARLNIIETNMDFYMFVLKYFRQYEPDFVFKSVPCIQTCGRHNMVPRPPNGYLGEKIL